jgi:hypothetical protein
VIRLFLENYKNGPAGEHFERYRHDPLGAQRNDHIDYWQKMKRTSSTYGGTFKKQKMKSVGLYLKKGSGSTADAHQHMGVAAHKNS